MPSAVFFGNNFPFYDRTFVLPLQTDERLIKNDLLQLLLTSPGERVKRPDYGTFIRRFAFEPMDVDSFNILRDSIETAVKVYEPRVDLKDVIFNTTPDQNLASVSVLVSLKNTPNRILEVEARLLSGEATRPEQQRAITVNG